MQPHEHNDCEMAMAVQGQLSQQGRRSQALADFQAGQLAVLVATELAAVSRG